MLRYTTAGESHGKCLITSIEGLPYGTPLDAAVINEELSRRQGGYGRGARIAARLFQQHAAYTPADVRIRITSDAIRRGLAPLDSPTSAYTFDGVREGVAVAP